MNVLAFLSPEAQAALRALVAEEVERQLAERERARAATPWLSVPEAAGYLRLSEKAVRNRLARLPHHRLDGRILLRRDELDAALAYNKGRDSQWPGSAVNAPGPAPGGKS